MVLPGSLARSEAVESRWLAAADLAEALGARLGGVRVLTEEGPLSPSMMRDLAIRSGERDRPGLRRLPRGLRVLAGDLRVRAGASSLAATARRLPIETCQLVVQFHRRFHQAGMVLARRARAPLVLRVEALEVREESAWGVRRPGWGRLVERLGEWPVLRKADLCAAVSDEVDRQLDAIGVPPERRIVLPNGVDVTRFSPGPPEVDLRLSLGLADRFVVGWIGGFRPFHGLDLIPDLARALRFRVPDAVLCLIGTGPLRHRVEEATRGMEGIRLFPPVPRAEVPRWIRMFDACVVLAGPGPFHYSPLKLYEYMACGRPVVAPSVGGITKVVRDGHQCLLVPPGDPGACASALARLADDHALRSRLATAARHAAELASWDVRAKELLQSLSLQGLSSYAGARFRW